MHKTSSRHVFILSLAVGMQFAAVTFLLPLLRGLGTESPWLESAFYLAHITALPLLGLLADRWGTRRVLTLSLLGELLAFGLLAWSLEPGILLSARLLSGASSAVLPVCFAWVRRGTQNEHELSRGIATVMLGITAGGASGALVAGLFSQNLGTAVSLLILGNALTLALVRTLPDRSEKPGITRGIHDKSPTTVRDWGQIWRACGLPVRSSGAKAGSKFRPQSPRQIERRRHKASPLLSMALVFLFVSTGFFLYRTLLSFRFEDARTAALALALLSLGAGAAQIALVLKPVPVNAALKGFLGCLFVAEVSFILGIEVTGTLVLFSLALLGPAIGAADVLGGATLASFTQKEKAGISSGMIFGIGALGKILGPSLAAVFSTSLPQGFFLAALFGTAGLVILLRLTRSL